MFDGYCLPNKPNRGKNIFSVPGLLRRDSCAYLRLWWVWAGIRPGRCAPRGRGRAGRSGCRSSGPSGAGGGWGSNLRAWSQPTGSTRRNEFAWRRSSPTPKKERENTVQTNWFKRKFKNKNLEQNLAVSPRVIFLPNEQRWRWSISLKCCKMSRASVLPWSWSLGCWCWCYFLVLQRGRRHSHESVRTDRFPGS